MDNDRELSILKFIAVAAAAYYVWRISQKSGISMGQMPEHMRPNPESLVDLTASLFPEAHRPKVRRAGTMILNKMMEN